MEANSTIQTIMLFITSNIAYILLAAAVGYFIWFIYSIVQSRRTGEGFTFRFKSFFAFLLVIGVAIYCLVTGTDLSTFIH